MTNLYRLIAVCNDGNGISYGGFAYSMERALIFMKEFTEYDISNSNSLIFGIKEIPQEDVKAMWVSLGRIIQLSWLWRVGQA